jgi:hypothetical protein
MSEPTTAGAATVFSAFAKYFKLSRSPYLFAGILCVLAILSIAGLREARSIFFLGFIPCGAIFLFLALLCLYLKPVNPKISQAEQTQASQAEQSQASAEQAQAVQAEEIDEQFKFSRAFCVGIGVLLLTYLLYKLIGAEFFFSFTPTPPDPIEPGFFFFITYAACLIHLLIFASYTLFRTIKEESVGETSIFQIAFFTVAILWGIVYSCTKIHDQQLIDTCPSQLIYKDDETASLQSMTVFGCNYEQVKRVEMSGIQMREPKAQLVDFKQGLPTIYDTNKIVFWYFLILLIQFEYFWIERLVRVVKFQMKVEILD